jgi:tRNA(Ile)-lysidine synthase
VSKALERRVCEYVRRHELVRPGDRVGLAVSGGADSVALLRLMLELRAELGIVLSIAHFNHGIRGDASDADENFVRELAQAHGLDLHISSGDAPAYAHEKKLSLETAARDLRYSFFRELISSGAVSKLMTAHTLDDQAETVLMRVVRGTGTAGLAGIYPRVSVQSGEIIRPLLAVRRCEIEEYLRGPGQTWREDATNLDVKHTRNKIRHLLLPLLESEFNPAVRHRLAELAEIARNEEQHWDEILCGIDSPIVPGEVCGERVSLDAERLARLPVAVQRRIVRQVVEHLSLKLDFEKIDAVQRFASESGRSLELPNGWSVTRQIKRRPSGGKSGTLLIFDKSEPATPQDYKYSLAWPGEVAIREAGLLLQARLVTTSEEQPPTAVEVEDASGPITWAVYNLSYRLDPQKLLPGLTIRNWRAGDHFWPAHSSGPKKVKQLLQQRHVTGAERVLWPVAVSGDEIVWMRGFPVSEKHRATNNSGAALLIEEILQ